MFFSKIASLNQFSYRDPKQKKTRLGEEIHNSTQKKPKREGHGQKLRLPLSEQFYPFFFN